jgi:hypothetical protein
MHSGAVGSRSHSRPLRSSGCSLSGNLQCSLRRGDAQKNAPKTQFDDRADHEATATFHCDRSSVFSQLRWLLMRQSEKACYRLPDCALTWASDGENHGLLSLDAFPASPPRLSLLGISIGVTSTGTTPCFSMPSSRAACGATSTIRSFT